LLGQSFIAASLHTYARMAAVVVMCCNLALTMLWEITKYTAERERKRVQSECVCV